MSHDQHNNSKENPFVVPFRSAFWLVLILVGLYIAALNFISAESGSAGEKKEEAATEMKAPAAKSEAVAAPKAAETPKTEEKKEEAPKAEN